MQPSQPAGIVGPIDRRQILTAGGLILAACGAGPRRLAQPGRSTLDRLLDAHSEALPERAGAGANHYPMAAEALAALGHEASIELDWIAGARHYAGPLGRRIALHSPVERAAALGDYGRYGDWLDYFRGELQDAPWRPVVGRWAPRLAPALSAAAFHGVIRTGHATRALGHADTPERRGELAAGLAYWAARYQQLPAAPDSALPSGQGPSTEPLDVTLAGLDHPWLDVSADVDFFAVGERLAQAEGAAPLARLDPRTDASAELDAIVRAAATAFLEMLVLKRSRLWLLHTVTGPAAVQWLLPHVDGDGARRLVEFARQAVIAMFQAYGEPFAPRAHLRQGPAPWSEHISRAVANRSVHGIKLVDALARFDRDGDRLWRSVAEQWFEWT